MSTRRLGSRDDCVVHAHSYRTPPHQSPPSTAATHNSFTIRPCDHFSTTRPCAHLSSKYPIRAPQLLTNFSTNPCKAPLPYHAIPPPPPLKSPSTQQATAYLKYRLLYPPRRIGAELEAPLRVELFDRSDQAEGALLRFATQHSNSGQEREAWCIIRIGEKAGRWRCTRRGRSKGRAQRREMSKRSNGVLAGTTRGPGISNA